MAKPRKSKRTVVKAVPRTVKPGARPGNAVVNVMFSGQILDRLEAIANSLGRRRNDVIREIVATYVAEKERAADAAK